MPLRRKYLAGWMKSESMQEAGWSKIWIEAAKEAEDKEHELAIFAIPKKNTRLFNEAIAEIETLLQNKFGK